MGAVWRFASRPAAGVKKGSFVDKNFRLRQYVNSLTRRIEILDVIITFRQMSPVEREELASIMADEQRRRDRLNRLQRSLSKNV